MAQVVTFSVDDTRFGLPVAAVRRVLHAQWVTPLPEGPRVILGVIDFEGQALAAVSLRRRFGLPERAMALADRLIVADTERRTVALHVDAVGDVIDCRDGDIFAPERIAPGIGHVAGVTLFDDGLLLIQDLGTVLSLEEHLALDEALAARA